MTNDLKIRGFQWNDLGATVDLFNRIDSTVGTEKEISAEFVQQMLSQPSVSPEVDLSLALLDSEPVAYLRMFPEIPIRRAVAAIGVLPRAHGHGIAQMLLRMAVERAENLEVDVLHVQTSAESEDIRSLLESEGFDRVKDYWQMRWEIGDLPEIDMRPNFRLEPFRPGRDEAMLTELQNTAFGQHWGFCPNTVEEIGARTRLPNTEPNGIIFIMDGDTPAGYNWTLRNKNQHGHIGFVSMTGVHPSYRGNGLGTAVVVSGMRYLVSTGVGAVELEVDAENAPARELYRKLGFTRVHHSVWYERKFG